MRHMRRSRGVILICLAVLGTAGPALPSTAPGTGAPWPRGAVVVTYASVDALARVLQRRPAAVLRQIPALRVALLKPAGDAERYAALVADEPGVLRVERAAPRRSRAEPALAAPAGGSAPLQWQYAAIGADRVPPEVARAATAVTIAVVDTGADLLAPDLAAKSPVTRSVRAGKGFDVADVNGHGTFVAALAAGSSSNGEGIAGVAGDAKLVVVQAGGPTGTFTDVEEAAAIVYAVDQGARIVNLSLGGPTTSSTEKRAIDYAVSKGALLVAAAGNSFAEGNPVQYPAALLQPVGSRGVGGRGLAVAASTRAGTRAPFSSTGTHVSLAAPGANVFSAVSASSSRSRYPRTPLPGSSAGLYGYGSGTSFASPQVAGAAALVWAANPTLQATEVASILKETASGAGSWTPELGYGVVDVAAAVARAQRRPAPAEFRVDGRRAGTRVDLAWQPLPQAAAYRVAVVQDRGPERVLTNGTSATAASYAVSPGSQYAFTVTALDGSGAAIAVSPAYTLSLRQAPARVSLAATRQANRIELRATLRVEGLRGAESARTVALESFDGSTWTRAATARTDATGRARWSVVLSRGKYRIRASYPGSADIAPAASRPLTLAVR